MERLRQVAAANLNAQANAEHLSTLEQRLQHTEQELARTRLHLNEERERRNRAISLIRPQPAAPLRPATPALLN